MTPRPPFHWSNKPSDNSPWWLLCLIPVGGLVAGHDVVGRIFQLRSRAFDD